MVCCLLALNLFAFPLTLHAQEMLGIMNSSYSGISGSLINPALTVASPYYIDINLVTANVFAENNYLYMPKEEYRFSRFLQQNPEFPTHGPKDNLVFYDYYNRKDKDIYAQARLMGPSVAVTVGKNSFGITTGARAVASAKNIPYDIAKFAFEQLEYPPQFDINYIDNRNIYNAQMAWMETGLTYSREIFKQGLDYWTAGITVKDLRGYAGAYLSSENIDYVLLEHDTLIIHNMNVSMGLSLPVDYYSNSFTRDPLIRGKGIGLDLGVVYEQKKSAPSNTDYTKLCGQTYVPYKIRIGISLLDIGRIKFTQNAERLEFVDASTYWPGLTLLKFSSVQDFVNTMSTRFYGDTTQLVQGNSFKIALPTALSVQGDYNITGNWYASSILVCPVQFYKAGIRRPWQLAVTPRYQTRLFEIGLPVSIYDKYKPRVGLNLRFLGFFIGTEKLGGFFHFHDFTGLDLYVGLKVSLRKGNCRSKFTTPNCGISEYKKFIKSDSGKKVRNRR
jgi:hypothetical protein